MSRLAFVLLLALAACGRRPPTEVAFRVRVPIVGAGAANDDRALAGATRLALWVESTDGQRLDGSERSVRLPSSSLALPSLPFGAGYVLRVEAYGGDVLLSRGRSWPFDVDRRGARPLPDLFLGSLGRHGHRLAVGASVVAALPTGTGALLALADGSVARFAPFDAAPISALGVARPADTIWLAAGRRALAGFSPSTHALALVDGAGVELVDDPLLARHGAGAMLASDVEGDALFLAGGLDASPGESALALTRVDLTTRAVTELGPLPASRWGGSALYVPGATSADDRVVVLGGSSHGAASDALVIDPALGSALAVSAPAIDAETSLVVLGAGQVLAVGGAGADDVRLFVLALTPAASLMSASPSPPTLSLPRRSPRLVRFADGLVLVVGGTSGGALVHPSELVDLRVFPGQTVQTGALPDAVSAPAAFLLDDRAVWVFDPAGVYGYVPPRGP